MKNRASKLLSVLICIAMFFATLNVTTVFADVTTNEWLTEDQINIPTDYEFSFMVIGDTQIVTRWDESGLGKIYDYVISNVQKKKVKHVMGLGDITDADKDWEWKRATKQIARMDGVVPYSIIRGNHDIYSTRNHPDNTSKKDSMNYESPFDEFYGAEDSPYAKQYTYFYDYGEGKENFRARNTVHFFSSSSRDYMVVALDYGPNDDILAWANGIIEAHPYHNVIITTHSYLQKDGTTLDAGEPVCPTRDFKDSNNGDNLWNELISKHKNVVMVLCGHMSCEDVLMVKREGENGNEVTQFLIDPQGMDTNPDGSGKGGADFSKGMVATFYVDENGEDITVDWYSTSKGKYYRAKNNYSFKVNTIERHLYGKVSYNANGGTGEMESVDVYKPTFTIPTECPFEKPAKNKKFKGWAFTPNGNVITTETITLNGNVTLYAIWEEIELPKFRVTVNRGTSNLTAPCEEETLVTITANEPSAGKRFKFWTGADNLTFVEGSKFTATATFKMPANNVTVTATYESIEVAKPEFTINASAGENGSISNSGAIKVKEGESYTFTFTANDGYEIKDVLVDGVSVGAVSTYTFTNVTKSATIAVEFKQIEVTPPPVVDDGNDQQSSSGCGNKQDAGSATILVTFSLAVLMALKKIKG